MAKAVVTGDRKLPVGQIAIIALAALAVIVAVVTVVHTVNENQPQVVSVMKVAPGSFGKGAWLKAHHLGAWAPGKTPPPDTSSGSSASSKTPGPLGP